MSLEGKKTLLRVHQWLGTFLGLLGLLWFLSGVVMTFVGYPRLDERERLQLLPPLVVNSGQHCFEPHDSRFQGAELVQRAEGVLCVFTHATQRQAFWLEGQRPYESLSAQDALVRVASALAGAEGESKASFRRRLRHYQTISIGDQWTLPSRFYPYFPMHHVVLDDRAGREFYVSARTGEIAQITTSKERFWAWLGAIPHWIYPAILRRQVAAWRWLVIALSSLTFVMVSSGLLFGVILQYRRWKRHRRLNSPFSKRLYRWHQQFGLAVGLVSATWLLSGVFSMNPFRWSPGASPREEHALAFRGQPSGSSRLSFPTAVARCRSDGQVRLMRSFLLGGHPYYLCFAGAPRGSSSNPTRVVSLENGTVRSHFSRSTLQAAFRSAFPTWPVAEADWLDQRDEYYYPTHYQPDRARFPCLRLQLDDDARSTVYLDARRGNLQLWHTSRSRAERWLYHGLHSFDFAVLYENRLLWHVVVVSLLVLGIVSSATGVVLGWRFALRKSLRRRA